MDGRKLCTDPYQFTGLADGRARLRRCTTPIIKDIIIDLNAEISERESDDRPLDYKRELKSPKAVRELGRSIVTQYQKSVLRGRVPSFGAEWADTAGASGEKA